MQRYAAIVVLLLILAAPCAVGSDGATPIWEPVDITEPGLYRLTRNMPPNSGIGIKILVDNVDLDLNGFVLEAEIDITGATLWIAPGVANVYVHDGTVINTGGYMPQPAIQAESVSSLRIERVSAWAAVGAVGVNGDHISIRDCSLGGLGFESLSVAPRTIAALVEGNLIQGGLTLIGDYIIVRGNTVGDGINLNGSNNIVVENTVRTHAIEVDGGTGNHLQRNNVSGSSWGGIHVWSDYNLIEDNVLVGNDRFGLRLTGSYNVYRGNVSRNNTSPDPCPAGGGSTDFCDEGTGNTSNGDNYMPGAM